ERSRQGELCYHAIRSWHLAVSLRIDVLLLCRSQNRLQEDNAARSCSSSRCHGIFRTGASTSQGWLTLHTNWVGETAIQIPFWLSDAHASLAGDFAGSRRRAGTLSDKSNAGSASASSSICFLCLPSKTIDGRICGTSTRDAPGVFHLLSLVAQRSECLTADCTSVYVCLPGRQRRATLENLFIGGFSWFFVCRSAAIDFFCTVVARDGSVADKRGAAALVPSLCRTPCCFRVDG